MSEWFEDDELWRVLQPALFAPDILAKAPAEIDQLLVLAPLPPGSAILDLPCGIGRHSVELARRGMCVTAVDRTRVYLEQAREAAREAGLSIEFTQADMRTFIREQSFDAVFNLWTSFGYFDDPGDDLRTLRNFHASLRPGGRLVMELLGKEALAKQFMPRMWRELPDGTLLLQEHTLEQDWGRVINRWIIINGDQRREVRFALRLYAASELKRLAAEAGFVDTRCFSGFGGKPYDDKATRLLLTSTRPG